MDFSGIFSTTCYQSSIFIKIDGWAVQNNSLFFKDFIDKMVEANFKDFIIYLLDCKGMDSTFMGTLLYIVNEVKTVKCPITLVNTNNDHRNLLKNLGIINMLNVTNKTIEMPKCDMQRLFVDSSYCAKRHIELVKKAHECLVALNDKNKEQFSDFLELLDEELS